jgi:hypothetical protein
VLVGVVLAVLAGPFARSLSSPASATAPNTPGDPHGRILAELEAALRGAVPTPVTGIDRQGYEPVITSSCDSTIPAVADRILFTSRQSVAQVTAQVSAAMRRSGWGHRSTAGGQWYADVDGKQVLANNDIVRWTRRLPQGRAGASLTVGVPVSDWKAGDPLQWLLADSAMGIDEPKRHCGEG